MISDLIFVGSIFLVFVTIYLLFFTKNASKSYADYLLTFTLLTHTWSVVLYLVLYSEYILYFPHLFKTGLPINFLIAPLSYLYVRAVLYNEKQIQFKDLLHAVPFLIVFINYIPFYVLPVDIKLKIINSSLNYWPDAFKYQAGILPENLAILFRIVLAIFYIIHQWKIILSYKKEHKTSSVQVQIQNVHNWLKLFTITSTVILLGLLSIIIAIYIFPSYYNNDFVTQIPSLLVAIGFFIMAAYLLTHQEVLSGLPFIKYKAIASNVSNDKSYNLPYINEDYSNEMELIRKYFERDQPFLQKDLSINHVSIALNIPSRELSYIFNNHFGQRFNDFLNRYRIEYITKKINKVYLANYTMEAIANEAGFASKSSFNLAFKKFNQCTPSEYLSRQS
jgi:AraC-like DNA-binding protein